jgi:hypothetical protein
MGSDREKKVIISMEEYKELLESQDKQVERWRSIKEEVKKMHKEGMFCTRIIKKYSYPYPSVSLYTWSDSAKELELKHNTILKLEEDIKNLEEDIKSLLSEKKLLKNMNIFQYMKWRKKNG